MSLPDLDILEVKSVSDMISVFETPADDAAKLIGEDDVAIFSPPSRCSAAASVREERDGGEKHKAGM